MPCTSVSPKQKAEQREALKRLEIMLQAGGVGLRVGENGAIVFEGWMPMDRKGFSDVCAFTMLQEQGSFALQQAVQRAEMAAGRSIDMSVIAAGVHSHDGGKTWSTHAH